MGIYNRTTAALPSVWAAADRQHGARVECAVDVNADVASERIEWLNENGFKYLFITAYVLFFETEADGLRYYLTWGHLDHPDQ